MLTTEYHTKYFYNKINSGIVDNNVYCILVCEQTKPITKLTIITMKTANAATDTNQSVYNISILLNQFTVCLF